MIAIDKRNDGIASFLLKQRICDFSSSDLELSLDLATKIGCDEEIVRLIRLRMGGKYSEDVPMNVKRICKCRTIAKEMNEFMVREEMEVAQKVIEYNACRSKLFLSLKESLIYSMKYERPFSDDNLMAVYFHAKEYHPDVFEELFGDDGVFVKTQERLLQGEKESVGFVWFEDFLVNSAVCSCLVGSELTINEE